MKKLFTSIVFLGLGVAAFAQQIPNSGFETWTSPSNPDSWGTWESATGAPLGLATKDTVSKIQGTASIKIKTDSVQAGPSKRLIPGLALFGSLSYAPPAPLAFIEAAFSGRPDTLFFSYKYTPATGDTALVEISASGPAGNLLGGALELPSTNGAWLNLYIPITANYSGAGAVDSFSLLFTSSASNPVAGSVLNVDAIRLGYRPNVGIEKLANELGVQVYPNPVATDLIVSYNGTDKNVYFEMVDAMGKIVLAKDLASNTTTLNLAKIANGNYFYRISTNGIVIKSDGLSVVK